jgi:uncharacterized protein YciI
MQMKKIRLFTLLFLLGFYSFGQNQEQAAAPPQAPPINTVLVKKLGADDYGMKKYVMAILKKGKKEIKDTTELAKIHAAHLQNIQRLMKERKLLIAGPFLDEGDLKGVFIFDVQSVDDAQQLVSTDPGVQAGIYEVELHPWYGTASLGETPMIHKAIAKKSITEMK